MIEKQYQKIMNILEREEKMYEESKEDELEASSITGVTKEGTVAAKSTKGF